MKDKPTKRFTVTVDVFIQDGAYSIDDFKRILMVIDDVNEPDMKLQIREIKEEEVK